MLWLFSSLWNWKREQVFEPHEFLQKIKFVHNFLPLYFLEKYNCVQRGSFIVHPLQKSVWFSFYKWSFFTQIFKKMNKYKKVWSSFCNKKITFKLAFCAVFLCLGKYFQRISQTFIIFENIFWFYVEICGALELKWIISLVEFSRWKEHLIILELHGGNKDQRWPWKYFFP